MNQRDARELGWDMLLSCSSVIVFMDCTGGLEGDGFHDLDGFDGRDDTEVAGGLYGMEG